MDRRNFLKITGVGAAGSAMSANLSSGVASTAETIPAPELHLFSKVLEFLDYEELAQAAAAIGLQGLDLTVRPRGHVEPDNFEHDLPAAINAAKAAGLNCDTMVTNIVGTQNQRDYDLLALARELGVKCYRTGSLRYSNEMHPMDSVKQYAEELASLAEWNREIGITGVYQNHSGEKRFAAAAWDLYLVLKDLDPDYLGCQFDVRHATTDGGRMWPDSYRLLKPYIRSLAIKDFKWAVVDGQWSLISTPIGQGMVDFRRYFRMLKDDGMKYPLSLHVEYELGGAEKGNPEITIPQSKVLNTIRQDIEVVQKLWAEA